MHLSQVRDTQFYTTHATLMHDQKACAHTAFQNPLAPEDAAPRESIETRSLVLTKIS
jgi:hypothetical protein